MAVRCVACSLAALVAWGLCYAHTSDDLQLAAWLAACVAGRLSHVAVVTNSVRERNFQQFY